MSLISRMSRSAFCRAMRASSFAFGGNSPTAPASMRPSEPRIDVNGVRSSCETMETNSLLSRSISFRSVMSRTTQPRPAWSRYKMPLIVSSTSNVPPSLRRPRISYGFSDANETWRTTASRDSGATKSFSGRPSTSLGSQPNSRPNALFASMTRSSTMIAIPSLAALDRRRNASSRSRRAWSPEWR